MNTKYKYILSAIGLAGSLFTSVALAKTTSKTSHKTSGVSVVSVPSSVTKPAAVPKTSAKKTAAKKTAKPKAAKTITAKKPTVKKPAAKKTAPPKKPAKPVAKKPAAKKTAKAPKPPKAPKIAETPSVQAPLAVSDLNQISGTGALPFNAQLLQQSGVDQNSDQSINIPDQQNVNQCASTDTSNS